MNGDLLKHVQFYATEILGNLSSDLCYHDLRHTIMVAEAVDLLSEQCRLSPDEREIVSIAAWFHDTGFSVKYRGHEEASQKVAGQFLTTKGYDPEKMNAVLACIGATHMPQCPNNLLQSVLCDADLSHLSKDIFLERLKLLRREWKLILNESYNDKKWYTLNAQFLQSHEYFTLNGKWQFQKGKYRNIARLKKLLSS